MKLRTAGLGRSKNEGMNANEMKLFGSIIGNCCQNEKKKNLLNSLVSIKIFGIRAQFLCSKSKGIRWPRGSQGHPQN